MVPPLSFASFLKYKRTIFLSGQSAKPDMTTDLRSSSSHRCTNVTSMPKTVAERSRTKLAASVHDHRRNISIIMLKFTFDINRHCVLKKYIP